MLWLLCALICVNLEEVFTCTNRELKVQYLEDAISYRSSTAEPCDDFYQFACGKWRAKTHYKFSDHSKLAGSRLNDAARDILTSSNDRMSSTAEQKIKTFYKSCMSSNYTKAEKIASYTKILKSFSTWPVLDEPWHGDNFDWLSAIAVLRRYRVDALIRAYVRPNWKNSSESILYLMQDKLPYLSRKDLIESTPIVSDEQFIYKTSIKYVMLDLGCKIREAKRIADDLLDFETKLARIMSDEEDIPIPEPRRLDISRRDINWNKYLSPVFGNSADQSVVAMQGNYFNKLTRLIERTPKDVVAKYLLFRFFWSFDLVRNVYLGSEEENCLKLTSTMMGPILEKVILKNIGATTVVQKINEMINQLTKTFETTLEETSWLDEVSRNKAKTKLSKLKIQIGSGENIKQSYYDDFEVDPTNYHQSLQNFRLFMSAQESRDLKENTLSYRIHETNPLTINAYYGLTTNTLKVPLGIIQPPFYDTCFPAAFNFGALGSILSHEFLHGFDFDGQMYDEFGSIKAWWTPKSIINYFSEAECLINQYNNFAATNTNGLRTLSENSADNGGLKLAYKTFQRLHAQTLNEEVDQFHMKGSQVFFLSFAQIWCSDDRDLSSASKHAKHRHRVNGVLSNFDEFSKAFQCEAGLPMNPTKKCKIW